MLPTLPDARYSRANFRDPNQASGSATGDPEDFYGDAESSESEEKDDDEDDDGEGKSKHMMDPDHRLLLRSAVPLLQSRNSAVIMAVVHLYRYAAPNNELGVVAKPLMRMLRSHREVQSIALTILATMCADPQLRPTFYVYLKNFFVRSDDPEFIRTLKLEIMCCLTIDSNVGLVLREYQVYVQDANKHFACQTIQCIGRVAAATETVTDQCLQGLMSLLTEEDETVVGESVV
jgi:AP-3 complex subunit beta